MRQRWGRGRPQKHFFSKYDNSPIMAPAWDVELLRMFWSGFHVQQALAASRTLGPEVFCNWHTSKLDSSDSFSVCTKVRDRHTRSSFSGLFLCRFGVLKGQCTTGRISPSRNVSLLIA